MSQREAGLKVTYNTKNKQHKQLKEENRILRKLLSNKEIELEVQLDKHLILRNKAKA